MKFPPKKLGKNRKIFKFTGDRKNRKMLRLSDTPYPLTVVQVRSKCFGPG